MPPNCVNANTRHIGGWVFVAWLGCITHAYPSVTACYPAAGVELYMLPAIDMINHATEPDKRNTLLRKSSAELTVKVDGAPLTLQGFFTMKAGQLSLQRVWVSPCSMAP